MTLRIRLRLEPGSRRSIARSRRVALVAAAFLSPAALVAFVLGLWGLASQAGWASASFLITGGLFSYWQVWIAAAAALEATAVLLNRYGRRGRREQTI